MIEPGWRSRMREVPENPKQAGSNVTDANPNAGPCPHNCNQCYYNRAPLDEPELPSVEQVAGRIVRVCSGHDANVNKAHVISATAQYEHRFFNTSMPDLRDFPAPVVLTVNPREEGPCIGPDSVAIGDLDKLMFVRARVSPSNIDEVLNSILGWCRGVHVPMVLTFMDYYDCQPPPPDGRWLDLWNAGVPTHVWKKRHVNEYWCPSSEFQQAALEYLRMTPLVTMCGTPTSNLCADCRNCETYYWQAMKRMLEQGVV